MKLRVDFVTNSSSSSFLIAKKDVELDFLINTVMKDFYVELHKQWDDEEDIDWEAEYDEIDILNNENTNFTINETPQHQWDDDSCYHCYWGQSTEEPDPKVEEYEIYNNCCIRFNWDIVEKIMNKYNIPYRTGYCD